VEQRLVDLSDGALLLIVFKNWLTPEGNQISTENPIQPDEIVEYEAPDSIGGLDSQQERALELLRN
jgi:C-terminal processing protease CtpA/Prc